MNIPVNKPGSVNISLNMHLPDLAGANKLDPRAANVYAPAAGGVTRLQRRDLGGAPRVGLENELDLRACNVNARPVSGLENELAPRAVHAATTPLSETRPVHGFENEHARPYRSPGRGLMLRGCSTGAPIGSRVLVLEPIHGARL